MKRRSTKHGQPKDKELETLGNLIDSPSSTVDQLQKAIDSLRDLEKQLKSDTDVVILHYFAANAFDTLRHLRTRGKGSQWEWRQPEFAEGLFHLRTAMQHTGFSKTVLDRQLQIITNTANMLSSIGRTVEAIELYDRALAKVPFPMALANKGIALATLAYLHSDQAQANAICHTAGRCFLKALSLKKFLNPGVAEEIDKWLNWLVSVVPIEFLSLDSPFKRVRLAKSARERRYRQWCMENRLFLNPLNELGEVHAAARDTLHAPPYVTGIREGPVLGGVINQIKQEYVSARFQLWEGIQSATPHFSDKETNLYDTLDYPRYSLADQKIRNGFRAAYSLLDKIAFLLNFYFKLNIPDNEVNLNRIWFNGGKPKPKQADLNLNLQLINGENLALRGLFWLSRDIYDEHATFTAVAEPEARGLKEIRNQIEHKYLKVHEVMWSPESTPVYRDPLAFSIGRGEFEAKTLKIFKLSRAALIYAMFALHCEERLKAEKRDSTKLVPSSEMFPFDDRFKR